jgi:DnaJ-class molecular chaperone
LDIKDKKPKDRDIIKDTNDVAGQFFGHICRNYFAGRDFGRKKTLDKNIDALVSLETFYAGGVCEKSVLVKNVCTNCYGYN